MIVVSLGEVETYGRRAARGAGLAWGLAEEAGRAARWLAERGLPGIELLQALLAANDGRAYADMAPVIDGARWRSARGPLCPVCCGAALADRWASIGSGAPVRIDPIACPLLLLPFLHRRAEVSARTWELRWPSVRAVLSPDALAIGCDDDAAPGGSRAVTVTIARGRGDAPTVTHPVRDDGVPIASTVWQAIDGLAQRTYVPGTDESRARGAGAARTDND